MNKKNELYASSAKNTIALTVCMILLVFALSKNVPTPPEMLLDAQWNRHMHNPAIPDKVRNISSILSYPLYEISKKLAEPRIIINGVQAFVYQVADIDCGK